jgi:hypothetical protein
MPLSVASVERIVRIHRLLRENGYPISEECDVDETIAAAAGCIEGVSKACRGDVVFLRE